LFDTACMDGLIS